jgi:hypothetical protein
VQSSRRGDDPGGGLVLSENDDGTLVREARGANPRQYAPSEETTEFLDQASPPKLTEQVEGRFDPATDRPPHQRLVDHRDTGSSPMGG